jgi:hypothetical protein
MKIKTKKQFSNTLKQAKNIFEAATGEKKIPFEDGWINIVEQDNKGNFYVVDRYPDKGYPRSSPKKK